MPQSRKIITPIFRVSYQHIWMPSRPENSDKDVYSVTAIFDSDTDLKDLLSLVKEVRDAKWKDGKVAGFKSPFRRGVEDEFDLSKNPEYAGKIITTFRSYGRPVGVVGPDKQPIIDQTEFYSGCYAIASVTAYAYDRQGNKGVSFGLANLMKMKDGEPLASINKAEVDFAEIRVSDYGVDNSTLFDSKIADLLDF